MCTNVAHLLVIPQPFELGMAQMTTGRSFVHRDFDDHFRFRPSDFAHLLNIHAMRALSRWQIRKRRVGNLQIFYRVVEVAARSGHGEGAIRFHFTGGASV
jgi:hypothetical protein